MSICLHAPWQTSWEVNIRNEMWSLSSWRKTGSTPQKYVQRPSLRTTLIRSFRGVAPSGTKGNNACGKVSSLLERCVLKQRKKVPCYFPIPTRQSTFANPHKLLQHHTFRSNFRFQSPREIRSSEARNLPNNLVPLSLSNLACQLAALLPSRAKMLSTSDEIAALPSRTTRLV